MKNSGEQKEGSGFKPQGDDSFVRMIAAFTCYGKDDPFHL